MDLQTVFYKHPFATMVTAVFLFSLLVTALYFFGLIPGVRKTHRGFGELLVITVFLLVTTAASWFTAIILSSDSV